MHWILAAIVVVFALGGIADTDPIFDPAPPSTQGGAVSDPDG